MFSIYLVTNRFLCRDLLLQIRLLCRAGLQAVQLREKDLSSSQLKPLAIELRSITAHYGCKLLINGRLELAAEIGADGVHLPESGFDLGSIRQTHAHWLIGKSCHSLESARQAQEQGADFVLFGPIYATPSKKPYGPPQGTERLAHLCRQLHLPVIAIGGIDEKNLGPCMAAGAQGVGVQRALLCAEDPGSRLGEFRRAVANASNQPETPTAKNGPPGARPS